MMADKLTHGNNTVQRIGAVKEAGQEHENSKVNDGGVATIVINGAAMA